jgi:hypothetical protein
MPVTTATIFGDNRGLTNLIEDERISFNNIVVENILLT